MADSPLRFIARSLRSLYGLTQSLRAQKKQEEAAAVDQRFRKAWAQADIQLAASRF